MAEVLRLNGRPIDWLNPPKPTDKVMWSKKTTGGKKIVGSFRTLCHWNRLNNLSRMKFGREIDVIQPCYNDDVKASVGTHDLDAVGDFWIPGVDPWVQQRFFRANGFWCWYRHAPLFSNHIHGGTLPWHTGTVISDDYAEHGFKVGIYVDGGYSTQGHLETSSQLADYYNHAFGLRGQHTPGSDKSWFPADISATAFNLNKYVGARARRQRQRG